MPQFGDELLGLTVESVESSDSELLIRFANGAELAVTLSETGGDYGVAALETTITQPRKER